MDMLIHDEKCKILFTKYVTIKPLTSSLPGQCYTLLGTLKHYPVSAPPPYAWQPGLQ